MDFGKPQKALLFPENLSDILNIHLFVFMIV